MIVVAVFEDGRVLIIANADADSIKKIFEDEDLEFELEYEGLCG